MEYEFPLKVKKMLKFHQVYLNTELTYLATLCIVQYVQDEKIQDEYRLE